MGILELAVIICVTIVVYNIQQIKIILKTSGYTVDMFRNLLGDYRRFKGLIQNEPDRKVKAKYQAILNGLHFSIAGVIMFTFMILNERL
jgi:hypothetical protein